ncbi:tryptophan synthase subunit alpha [Gracilimonas sp. BCB1]|uniref:tryptophan synthase subunit alpha n=1 Tax=Gracilimonas sp. BCB1 TaxID=3152362 RepID=UPI0032D97BA4
MNRIRKVFEEKGKDSKLMSLFLTAGFPDLDATVDLILGFKNNGADIIELGMPFSDPLADGPTIQYSSDVAINNGITIDRIFEMVKEVRKQSEIPIILMGYMNPVLRYGVEKFCAGAEEAGVDGLIIPDIPIEEGGIIEEHAKNSKLSLIYLVAPNTSDERMKQADEKSEGFVYCVSVTGVTGAREGEEVSKSVNRFIERVKTNITRNPVMVGFGIKSHEDANDIASNADGFIVGSALIDTIKKNYPNEEWQSELFSFVHSLKFGK